MVNDKFVTLIAVRLSMETLAVSNHGIPEHIIDGVLEISKRFFALSTESKMKVRVLLCFCCSSLE